MTQETNKKVWVWIFGGLTLCLIVVSVGMLKFVFSVSAGNCAMDMLQNGATEALARQEAFRVGHITQVLYFFGVPFPGYLLLNVLAAHFLGVRIKSRPIPLWKSFVVVSLFGGAFFSASVAMWDKRPISGIIVGSFTSKGACYLFPLLLITRQHEFSKK